jgi:peroxiredoxin Q/BCP
MPFFTRGEVSRPRRRVSGGVYTAPMAKSVAVGDLAPDFELPGTDGSFRLSEHRGERVVLLFYPGDDTTVCTKQFRSYRDQPDAFAGLGATVVGISTQDVASHESFIAKHQLNVPLLADVGGKVSTLYGTYSPLLKMAKRTVIVIDEQGVIRHRHNNLLSLTYDGVDDIASALSSLPAPA